MARERAVVGDQAAYLLPEMKVKLSVYNGVAVAIELPLVPPVAATANPPLHMRAELQRCGWAPDGIPGDVG